MRSLCTASVEVGDGAEIEADGRAARRRLWACPARAQVLDGLARLGQVFG